MKYSNISAFEKHLESAAPNHFSPVYMILGKEPFVRKQALDRLTSLVLREEVSPELALHTFDAEKHDVGLVLRELESMSFFSKRRLIVVQNAEAFNKAATTQLESYFLSPNKTVCLVLVSPAINRATTFYKNGEKTGVLLDIPEEKPWEKEKNMVEWLRVEAARKGKLMSQASCQVLVKQLGTDQTLLMSELEKLCCYVGEKAHIDDADISAICGSVNVENGWQLGEAIFRNDASSSLRIARGLLEDGTALIALLRQIRSQFQTQYQICSLLTTGSSASDIAQEYPYMKGAILERNLRQAQAYGMARFKKGMLAIDATELQAKNSGADADFLADMLIVKLTTI